MPDLQAAFDAPWKQRYRVPATSVQLARLAPQRGLVVSNRAGVFQLYGWDVPTGRLHQLTDRPAGVSAGVIAPDGRSIYFLDDQDGNRIGHYVRVPWEGGPQEDLTPDLPPYSSFGIAFAGDGTCAACTVADADGFHLYSIDLATARFPRQLLHDTTSFAQPPVCSHNGGMVVLPTTERTGNLNCSLLAFDRATHALIGTLWDGPDVNVDVAACSPVAGDSRVLATQNRSGFNRPLLWDPRTGSRTDLDLPAIEGEVEAWAWSSDGEYLLLCQVHQARQRLLRYELRTDTLHPLDHPSGCYWDAGVASQHELVVNWTDSTHPAQPVVLAATTGAYLRPGFPAATSVADVAPARPWRSVSYESADGQAIQGWLGVPEGSGPFPLILHTHGGPSDVQMETFSAASQSWLDHGFAFLTINYRGSTTFGHAFEQQIWGDVGRWELEDMVAARAWAIAQGIARPDRIFVTGWSYGGYLALLALGTRPNLWAGAMAGAPIADWKTLYEDEAETLRGYDRALFGGSPDEKPTEWAVSSPSAYADQVRAPILIVQGRHDTNCPPRQVEQYVATMQRLGKSIEVHWFDAGHGSLVVEQAIEHQELMLGFALRLLRELDTTAGIGG